MDQATKNIISKMQQAWWDLEKARIKLSDIDGMHYLECQIGNAMNDLQMEMDELHSLEANSII